jgi:predicted GNAT superfamily acetyltransferase
MSPMDLSIRPFSSRSEYEACTDLQEEVWGRGFSEKVSAAILMIANKIGGLAAGAFDEEGVLRGFVFGITGVMDGRLVHWSDMLAVRDGERDLGLGTRLKRYQREVLLDRGVSDMRWTFDPLQGRNAYVNFTKLGCVSREYVENMYGETDSPLHRGIGTDRLVAIWHLDSQRVESRLSGGVPDSSTGSFPDLPWVLPVLESGDFASPGVPVLGLNDQEILLPVPSVIDTLMAEAMPLAIRWREATRKAFLAYLSRGYEIREFLRGKEVSAYLLRAAGERMSVGDSNHGAEA